MDHMSDDQLIQRLALGGPLEKAACERIVQLLTAVTALTPNSGLQRAVHNKSSKQYYILGVDGELQSSKGPVAEGELITSYMSISDRRLWHRPSDEFAGKFTILKESA